MRIAIEHKPNGETQIITEWMFAIQSGMDWMEKGPVLLLGYKPSVLLSFIERTANREMPRANK